MDDLFNLLNALESDIEIKDDREFLSLDIPIVGEISQLAEKLLITVDGKCDWTTIETLATRGYYVFPVERDSFGWLVGGIQTTKGVVTYG